MQKRPGVGRIALLATTLIWGTSFVVLKNTLDTVSTLYILAFRFTGAALLMLLFSVRELKKLDKKYITGGVLMGVCLFLAYVLQTYGLSMTTPGKTAFLTATYCIMVPFISWALFRRRPDAFNIAAAFVCVGGMALISLDGGLSVNPGDMLTIFCGVFYALHIIVTDRYAEGRSAAILSMLQFATAAVLAWIAALIFEPFPTAVPASSIWSIAYLCVMCTAVCFLLQTIGQQNTPPSQTAVIMTLESVFGAAISVAFFGEELTVRLFLGFLLVFAALIISETKLSFLHIRKRTA